VHSHESSPPVAPFQMPLMHGLGQALRWLREKQTRKQYRVAENAGITKGMLSAYETGRQRPSLETLEKILDTLGCDLNDLHNALQIVNGHPERIKGWRGWQSQQAADLSAGSGWPGRENGSLADGSGAAGAAPPPPSAAVGAGYAAGPDGGPGAAGAGDLGSQAGAIHDAQPGVDRAVPGNAQPGEVQEGRVPYGNAATARRGHGYSLRPGGWSADLDSILGRDRPRLALEQEQALSQMMDGFHSLVRYWHRSLLDLSRIQRTDRPEPPEGH
jgi:transcriptional regulator with XRE-family HTH domain